MQQTLLRSMPVPRHAPRKSRCVAASNMKFPVTSSAATASVSASGASKSASSGSGASGSASAGPTSMRHRSACRAQMQLVTFSTRHSR